VGENAPAGGREEVAHLVMPQTGQPDEHDRVLRIVVRQIVCIGIIAQQRRPLFEIRADDKRSWLSGAMNSKACDQPLAEFERRRAVHGALLEIRELSPDGAHSFKIGRFPSHERRFSIGRAFSADNRAWSSANKDTHLLGFFLYDILVGVPLGFA
jgi:hypothetical protein